MIVLYNKTMLKKKWLISLIIGGIFFLIGLLTLSDYNLMWDARNHFFKGQAFVNFFLRGRRNYQGLPITREYARYYRDYVSRYAPDADIQSRIAEDPNFRRSIYQDDVHTFDWLMERKVDDHPVFSDIGSAVFNIVFYEKLGWLRDDHSYHLFSLVLASILVGVVFHWMFKAYGFLPALIIALTLATTPLFWAESHFNIKDIPQLAFFSLAIFAFWQAMMKKSRRWIIISSLLAGCALATKFNVVFLPFILIPWFFISGQDYRRWWRMGLIYPLLMLAMLFVSWPQLWQQPIENFLNLVDYYRSVGTNIDYVPQFRTFFGFNTYAATWIFYTTYPWVIFLAAVGILKTKARLSLLFLLWLVVSIVRVSLPHSSIFGGVRQIIEYIPALSLLAGYGMYVLLNYIPNRFRWVGGLVAILAFVPHLITLVRLHPAENAYFNSFIGGLSGAKRYNLTSWGNTDGGIYRLAVLWLNENAELNAHVATAFSDPADFYIPELREDIRADQQFSGYLQKGEYIVALTHNSEMEHTYRLLYPENFLEPLYIYEIDNVPLIKIWKNDREHMRQEMKNLEEQILRPGADQKDNELVWDLKEVKLINRLEIEFEEISSCQPVEFAYFQISQDGEQWEILPETYPDGAIDVLGNQPQGGKLIAPIAGLPARYISLVVEPADACLLQPVKTLIKVWK